MGGDQSRKPDTQVRAADETGWRSLPYDWGVFCGDQGTTVDLLENNRTSFLSSTKDLICCSTKMITPLLIKSEGRNSSSALHCLLRTKELNS